MPEPHKDQREVVPRDSGPIKEDEIRKVEHLTPPFNKFMDCTSEFSVRPLISRRGIQAIYPEKEITAITYGSDRMAQLFGVLEDLPCIVLLDAIPTGTVEIIGLSANDRNDVIKLLRQLIAQFISQERYKPFFELMESLHRLRVEIGILEESRPRLRKKLDRLDETPGPSEWQMSAKGRFSSWRQ